jgi:hypothetical protein
VRKAPDAGRLSGARLGAWALVGSLVALLVTHPHAAGGAMAKTTRPVPVAHPPRAPARPEFTGTWALDTTRSVFGKIPGGRPIARTDVIDHRDPVLRQTLYLVLPTGPDTTVYQYTTDSARVVHRVDNRDIEARVWWEGTTLCLLSKSKIVMIEMSLGERWTLSPDGQSLTMTRRVKSPIGDGDQKLVFVKR